MDGWRQQPRGLSPFPPLPPWMTLQLAEPLWLPEFQPGGGVRRWRGQPVGRSVGRSGRLGFSGVWPFHSGFVGRRRVASLPLPHCHAGQLHLAAGAPAAGSPSLTSRPRAWPSQAPLPEGLAPSLVLGAGELLCASRCLT